MAFHADTTRPVCLPLLSLRSPQVEFKDPETGEKIDVGLVRCAASKQTAGGGKIDIGRSSGGGAGFGGGEKAEADDDGGDDGEEAEETKLDQFWNFPTIENEHTFSSFADFKKNYFTPFVRAWAAGIASRHALFQHLSLNPPLSPPSLLLRSALQCVSWHLCCGWRQGQASLWDATLPLQLTTAPSVQLQWQKLSVAKGLAKDDADMKTKGKKVRLVHAWLLL